jgi:hypothetical protein
LEFRLNAIFPIFLLSFTLEMAGHFHIIFLFWWAISRGIKPSSSPCCTGRSILRNTMQGCELNALEMTKSHEIQWTGAILNRIMSKQQDSRNIGADWMKWEGITVDNSEANSD